MEHEIEELQGRVRLEQDSGGHVRAAGGRAGGVGRRLEWLGMTRRQLGGRGRYPAVDAGASRIHCWRAGQMVCTIQSILVLSCKQPAPSCRTILVLT